MPATRPGIPGQSINNTAPITNTLGKKNKKVHPRLQNHNNQKAPPKKTLSNLAPNAIKRKKGKNKPGTVALRDIRKEQRKTDFCMKKGPFVRCIKNISDTESKIGYWKDPPRWEKSALQCVQEATEAYMIGLYEDTVLETVHGKRVTSAPQDMRLARTIRGETF